jgi:5-methylcytosine-specific restriction protein B
MGGPRDRGSALLFAMLDPAGTDWAPDYEDLRRKLDIRKKAIEPEREDQANQRLRTWMVFFRGLGLLYDDDGRLQPTQAGVQLHEILDENYSGVDDFAQQLSRNNQLRVARLIGPVIARYQLRTPATADQYAPGVDIHPLWAILKATRELDDRIHWEEVGRVLTKCLRDEDLPAAIETIREARDSTDYDPNDADLVESVLGSRAPDLGDDQQDRIIVWLSRAGFKDTFLELRNRPDGYRYLRSEFVSVVDEILENPPEYKDFDDANDYYRWLGEAPALSSGGNSVASDDALVRAVVVRARSVGDRSIIALVGPAGTGKTVLAREAAAVLGEGDPNRVKFVQFHAAFSYEQFIGGLAPTPEGGFEPVDGILIDFNERARRAPDALHVLVLDELSRADVGNVLGELLTYIEYRDTPFVVAALGREVRIAPNLIVLATLNPMDRSVINLDEALVRRLRQFAVPPDEAALRRILGSAGMRDDLIDQVSSWFSSLPDDAPFGHGLFVGVADEAGLHELWHEQLSFFLRRGGVTTYHSPDLVEDGYLWRRSEFSQGSAGPSSSNDDPQAGSQTPEGA